jgi:hypothetical protein
VDRDSFTFFSIFSSRIFVSVLCMPPLIVSVGSVT